MSTFTPFSHSLIAAGLVLGLAATSTLTVSVTPAAASTGSSTVYETGATQDLLVDGSGDNGIFGVSRDQWSVTVPPLVVWPVQDGSAISDGFGHRHAPTEGASTEHPGIDFASPYGLTVHAAATGVVSRVQPADRGGCGVNLAIDHVIRGERVTTVYCHLAPGSVRVQVGEQVTVSDPIAEVGNTGVSTGAHLHFEVRPGGGAPIDPLTWLHSLAA